MDSYIASYLRGWEARFDTLARYNNEADVRRGEAETPLPEVTSPAKRHYASKTSVQPEDLYSRFFSSPCCQHNCVSAFTLDQVKSFVQQFHPEDAQHSKNASAHWIRATQQFLTSKLVTGAIRPELISDNNPNRFITVAGRHFDVLLNLLQQPIFMISAKDTY